MLEPVNSHRDRGARLLDRRRQKLAAEFGARSSYDMMRWCMHPNCPHPTALSKENLLVRIYFRYSRNREKKAGLLSIPTTTSFRPRENPP